MACASQGSEDPSHNRCEADPCAQGNLGHHRSVGHGVHELKIDFGPGYRVYFGQDGDKVVVLLIGGDKKTQAADIKRAQEYWNDYTGA